MAAGRSLNRPIGKQAVRKIGGRVDGRKGGSEQKIFRNPSKPSFMKSSSSELLLFLILFVVHPLVSSTFFAQSNLAQQNAMAPKITLYFSIGSCSGASYMALSTVGADFETVQVDLKAHKTVDGRDYYTINPAGAVPALEVDGKILTENVAVLSYIADLKPEAKLLPPRGSWEYYKALEAVSLVATDLHKTIGALFNPALPAEVADFQKARFLKIVKRMDETLASQKWLVAGEDPTIGDYYANVVLSWTAFLKVDISEFKNVVAYQERFKAVPGIAAAMAEWMSGGKKK